MSQTSKARIAKACAVVPGKIFFALTLARPFWL
jgi:hypothetical protein